MKKSKAISLLLCLSLLASLLIPGTLAMPAKAAEGGTDNGMKVNKTAVANNDGTYTITLEAYATGEKFISEVKKDVPTDIILVLDQSGSMAQNMYTYDFRPYSDKSNSDFYNVRYNQEWENGRNLYYKQDDESYATVSVTVTPGVTYSPYGNATTNYYYYYYSNNLYAKVGTDYKKVTVSQEGDWSNRYYVYKIGEVEIARSQGRNSSPDFTGIDGNVLYYPNTDESKNVYTYTYTDNNGKTQTIGTSTGANTEPTFTLYERYQSGSITKLQALKNAVTTFANSVAKKAAGPDGDIATTEDNVNHRIAVVGFASQSGYGNNTELLSISGRNSGSVGVAYNDITQRNLKDVLQDMDTQAGKTMVNNAIGALTGNGATRTDLGMDMAQRILSANPVDTKERNRVVIVFTDGSPTSGSGFEVGVANDAISNAQTIKNSGVTVYSVGVFSGADATSAGTKPSNDLGQNSPSLVSASNWFMQNVSSNNGTPQNPSFYLSAGDAESLNTIFQKISEQIESGGSSTTLGRETVIKDIVAPAFDMPKNPTDIKVYTADSDDSTDKWKARVPFTEGTVTPDTENSTISVSGFSFKDKWCGKETTNGTESFHNGQKLIIEFTVIPKDGFLGGNNVYTNTSAGVYESSSAENAVVTFPKPQVNVPIKDVTVTAQDKNVYLLGRLTADQIKSGATVKCGNVELNLNESSYGLESWQTEYVNITVEIKDAQGKAVTNLSDLKDDTTYTITATVAPKSDALPASSGTAATAKSGNDDGDINVFKPVLTYKDSDVYYGDTAPENYNSNLTNTEWKHGETVDTSVIMIDTAPPLVITYTTETGKIVDNKINTKQDIAVDAAVTINNADVIDYTTFQHTDCTAEEDAPENGKFWLHVKTCQLTITKKGGADGEPYVFTVKKNNEKYSEVTIVGNKSETIYELPVGIYTIQEDEGWSWRYTGDNGNGASLTAQNPSDTITCTNSNPKPYWLNGYSAVEKNVYGTAKK